MPPLQLMSAMIFVGAIPTITHPKETPSSLDDALFKVATHEYPAAGPESPDDFFGDVRADWQSRVFHPKVLQFIHVFVTVLITVNMFASLVLILGVKSVRAMSNISLQSPLRHLKGSLLVLAQPPPPSTMDHLDRNDGVPLPRLDRAHAHTHPHRRPPHYCAFLLGRALRRITLPGKVIDYVLWLIAAHRTSNLVYSSI